MHSLPRKMLIFAVRTNGKQRKWTPQSSLRTSSNNSKSIIKIIRYRINVTWMSDAQKMAHLCSEITIFKT